MSQYSFCQLDLLKGRIWESVSPTHTSTHTMSHSGWISIRKNFYRSSTFKMQGNSRTASPFNEIFRLGTRCTTGHLPSRSTPHLWQGRVSNINSYWKWHRWSPSKHLHWRRYSTHFSWWRSESFCSLSYLILAGLLLLLLLLLVNKALIRFRVNAEGELNANEHTENGFF